MPPRRHFAGKPAGGESQSESESEYEEQVSGKEEEDEDRVKKIEIKPLKTQVEDLHIQEPLQGPIVEQRKTSAVTNVDEKVRASEEIKQRTRSAMVNAEESEIILAGDEIKEEDLKEEESSEEEGSMEEEGSVGSSEEDDSESDSDYGSKPVFIARNKKQPNTFPQQTTKTPNSTENRHEETLRLVERQIQQEHEEKAKIYGEDEEVLALDDTDDLDPVAELAQWKVRELKRIKREREELEAREKELEDYERRKAMTDEQILAEDRAKLVEQQEAKADQSSGPYMQRYYHKGAFFQDQEILQRNFNERLEDDYKNKKLLPKALQLRDMSTLGQKGRSKHRTLAEEDTSLPSSKRPRY
ncbi:hypothetical protein TRVA0_021S01156 [Trichomonascus vanleenenianus]|uniref:U4/U6-U5 snRNP complex subunit SPP381 n=1 Tax=Trichomonascus vanleenenianus TaxID=2268995 RepID=UPI003ECB8945